MHIASFTRNLYRSMTAMLAAGLVPAVPVTTTVHEHMNEHTRDQE
jgi:hypothetical protein